MSGAFKRTERIAGTLLRQLAQLIQQEMSDPSHKSLITLSGMNVSKDLAHAKVYFTALNEDPNAAVLRLNHAAGYLRMLLAKMVKLRTVPQLHFVYDESIEYGKRLSRLIDKANPDEADDSTDQ